MGEDRYILYYETDKIHILRENVTKEQVDKFLETLTPVEKACLRITKANYIKKGHDYVDKER